MDVSKKYFPGRIRLYLVSKRICPSVCIQSFITASSHQVFFWYITRTHLSYCFFSSTGMRLPVPRKSNVGRTRATPPAKTVSWTVAYRFPSLTDHFETTPPWHQAYHKFCHHLRHTARAFGTYLRYRNLHMSHFA